MMELVDACGSLPALGPYTPVVAVGDMVFVSAQAGVDPLTCEVPEGEFEQECRLAFTNLLNALRVGGATSRDVVKITLLYANIRDLNTINTVFAEIFADEPPARTAAMVQLVGGRRISVDAIAVKGKRLSL